MPVGQGYGTLVPQVDADVIRRLAENLGKQISHFRILQLAAISPEEGAQTITHLASSPAVKGVTGQYFVKRQAVCSSQVSYDRSAAERLWQVSAELTRL